MESSRRASGALPCADAENGPNVAMNAAVRTRVEYDIEGIARERGGRQEDELSEVTKYLAP
jgi:hypothetical protein